MVLSYIPKRIYFVYLTTTLGNLSKTLFNEAAIRINQKFF
jgi:hypothetical protein